MVLALQGKEPLGYLALQGKESLAVLALHGKEPIGVLALHGKEPLGVLSATPNSTKSTKYKCTMYNEQSINKFG